DAEITKVKIGDTLTAILNAFVDIAKDPYITRGNWVTSTTNTGNLMVRAGMHPLYVSAFMAQPITRDYIDFQASKESIIGNNSGDMKFKFRQNIVTDNLGTENLDITIGDKTITKPLYLIHQRFIKSEGVDLKEALTVQKIAKFLKIKNPTSSDVKLIEKSISRISIEHNNAFGESTVKIEEKSLEELRSQIKVHRDGAFQIAVLNKFEE